MSRSYPVVRRAGVIIAAGLLVAALVLGGSSREAFYANAVLQILSLGVLAWSVLDFRLGGLTAPAWLGLLIAGATGLVVLLQLVPLPPDLWTALPGRRQVSEGLAILGGDMPRLPLSLAPEETLFGFMKMLPALAAFVLGARFTPREMSAVFSWVLVLAAAATVALGLAQVLTGREMPLSLYYPVGNAGVPVGLMANVNHQAILLLMSLPFGAVLAARRLGEGQGGDGGIGVSLILFVLLGLIVLGVMVAGSLAGYGLLAPAILLAFVVARGRSGGSLQAGALLGVSLAVAVLAIIVASSPRLTGLGISDFSTSSLSRADIWAHTFRAIGDTFPAGAGLGAFQGLYPRYEDPAEVTSVLVNNAHNDYLEFVLEFGLAGVLLLASFLAWFFWRTFAIWRSDGEDGARLRRAASVAVLLVLLHSVVDYPLRTGAISVFAGLCLGMMAAPSEPRRRRDPSAEPAAEPARHVTI